MQVLKDKNHNKFVGRDRLCLYSSDEVDIGQFPHRCAVSLQDVDDHGSLQLPVLCSSK